MGNEEGTAPYPCWATCDSTTLVDGGVVLLIFMAIHMLLFGVGNRIFPSVGIHLFKAAGFGMKEDSMIYSVNELMHKYETSVGRNTNMLLGIVINDKGLVPATDVERINELNGFLHIYWMPFV